MDCDRWYLYFCVYNTKIEVMRIDAILGYLISIVCFLLGLVIAMSLFNAPFNYGINLVVATITITVAVLFYHRTTAIQKMLPYKSNTSSRNRKFLISNTLILSLELLVALLLLTMAIYRALGERMAVFG